MVQDLQLVFGQSDQRKPTALPSDFDGRPVVTISKVFCGHLVPQQFTGIHEWFNYTFSAVGDGSSLCLCHF